MFKAMMVIFVVGVGFNSGDNAGDIDVVLFETKEQCEFAKERIDEVTGRWGVGKGEDRKQMPVKKSVECFDIPNTAQGEDIDKLMDALTDPRRFSNSPRRVETPIKRVEDQEIEEVFEPRVHKRWND